MQWIVDTRMEEVTPMGEGELNAKENKEMICLHEKYPILTLLQPFLSTLILSFIFLIENALSGIGHTLLFVLKYNIYNPKL